LGFTPTLGQVRVATAFLLAHNLASLYFGRKPEVRVVTQEECFIPKAEAREER
jgi:hypothetical protein